MPQVVLEAMTHPQFCEFMAAILGPYVGERVIADNVSPQAAERYARDQHARLLPEGHLTPGHRFLRITSLDSMETVGGLWLWIDDPNKHAFLYNITIGEQYRRRGFATQALALVEEVARAAGCRTLGLNVFSSNDVAMAVYRKVGFRFVSSYWDKVL